MTNAYKYTKADAIREVKDAIREGEGFNYIRIFLNDLARGRDITWNEANDIMMRLINGEFGNLECSFGTL